MTIRGEKGKGEVLITVDGASLDWRSSLAVRKPCRPPDQGSAASGTMLAAGSDLDDLCVARGRMPQRAGGDL